MLRVILLTTVITLFQIVTSMTLPNEEVSGKILHRQRRLMVFPSGTILQVRKHIADYCRQWSPKRFFGFELLWVHKYVCTLIWIKSTKFTNVIHFFTKNPHLPIFLSGTNSPQWAMASSFTRFLDHTQRRTTVGRTPLEEWSARRRDLNRTTHNTHNRKTSMAPVRFEPTISAVDSRRSTP